MENTGYITIQGWMVNKLSLSGNELICYALIFGFCQDRESEFKGSQNYIAKSIGVTRENARKILERLIKADLIIKRVEIINGVKFCRYSVNYDKLEEDETEGGASKQCRGSNETSHNNINNNIYKETLSLNNKERVKKNTQNQSENFNEQKSFQSERLKKFLNLLNTECPYISKHYTHLLTESEFERLLDKYTSKDIWATVQQIENRVDLRKKYTNLYRTLLNWLKNNVKEQ